MKSIKRKTPELLFERTPNLSNLVFLILQFRSSIKQNIWIMKQKELVVKTIRDIKIHDCKFNKNFYQNVFMNNLFSSSFLSN